MGALKGMLMDEADNILSVTAEKLMGGDITEDDALEILDTNLETLGSLGFEDNIPDYLATDILDDFKSAACGDRSKLLNYFIDRRLKSLTEQIGEF